MSEQPVIQTRQLTRYFGSKAAVYELDLSVPRGGVFALLGRNGSGKTTTIRMVLGLLEPTRGEARILGYSCRLIPPEARARIGYLTEEHQLYSWMSVRQCRDFQAPFYPRWNEKVFQGVIDHFRLREGAKVRELSRGERAGLCLALTLAPDPELLILDDPAMGLDPVARRALIESMVYLTRRADRTIFFSTHELADVERVADFVAVLDRSVLRVSSFSTYKVTSGGTPAALGLFQAVNYQFPYGLFPRGALAEGPDGCLYGVTEQGGTNTSQGLIYRLDLRPKIRPPALSNGSITLTWSAIPGQRYQLQHASALTNWVDFGAPLTATGTPQAMRGLSTSEPLGFYRVRPLP